MITKVAVVSTTERFLTVNLLFLSIEDNVVVGNTQNSVAIPVLQETQLIN